MAPKIRKYSYFIFLHCFVVGLCVLALIRFLSQKIGMEIMISGMLKNILDVSEKYVEVR